MKKIFLCHSSCDKEYLKIVARKLGRARIIFDKLSFTPGQDFRKAIKEGIGAASFFVFFASSNSLKSLWCKFEIDQALFTKTGRNIDNFLTIIIDRDTRLSDLPRWMQLTKAVIQTRPSQATRDIQHALFLIYPQQIQKPYIGREQLHQELTTNILDLNGVQKRLFVVSGLEGIGRRTYLKHACRDIFGLELHPHFFIDETRDLSDVYLQALSETDDLGSQEDLEKEMGAFKKLELGEQVSEIVNKLNILCGDGCLPCLVDTGGMLDNEGCYLEPYRRLFGTFIESNKRDEYLAVIHTRKPKFEKIINRELFLFQKVQHLDKIRTRLLLQNLLHKINIEIADARINEILPFMEGYPPAVYFTATYIQEYGTQALHSDKSVLVDFNSRRFSRFLNDLPLSDYEWRIMQYLASEQQIQLSALAVVVEKSIEDTFRFLKCLIDRSIVYVLDDAYGISPPIRDAIIRSKGYLSKEEYNRIRHNLTTTFWSNKEAAPSIEIIDATLNAVARSGSHDFNPYQNLVRVSTVHRLARDCYFMKEWPLALEYAKRAEQMDPSRLDIRSIFLKSLVQLERWKDAEVKLKEIEELGDRNYFYLRGFMLRKRKRYSEAIKSFQSALDAGNHGYPVYRDMADCLYRLEEYEQAYNKLKWVLKKDSENIYVLDLIVRIFLDSKKIKKAEKYLEQLNRFDLDKKFIYHRRACYYASRAMWDLALVESENACATGFAPFEAFAQRIDIEIELQQFDIAATHLAHIEQRFRTHNKDIQRGLRCKFLIRQEKWREALLVWKTIEDKTYPGAIAMHFRILQQKSSDTSLNLKERESASRQAAELGHIVQQQNLYKNWLDSEQQEDNNL